MREYARTKWINRRWITNERLSYVRHCHIYRVYFEVIESVRRNEKERKIQALMKWNYDVIESGWVGNFKRRKRMTRNRIHENSYPPAPTECVYLHSAPRFYKVFEYLVLSRSQRTSNLIGDELHLFQLSIAPLRKASFICTTLFISQPAAGSSSNCAWFVVS